MWCHMTVPHSGTRYINDTFARSGYKSDATIQATQLRDEGVDLAYQHWVSVEHPKWKDRIREVISGADVAWCTVRDPSMTFATNWQNHIKNDYQDIRELRRCVAAFLQSMHDSYITQKQWQRRYDMGIFRVEMDPLSKIEEWTGAILTPGDRKSHGDYPLKAAIKVRDEDRIKEICKGTCAWERFKYETSLAYEYYKGWGYDLWWLDG